ncbi:hypothetical protein CCR87_16480 [Rhodobaculum claviforme]|uniref:Helix-hairpin-helix DNA-binding motif class 1 domain-containing protein n=1 Tax=Rhodobaculum claviforme TaxID=1549854 RepID=A0A934TMM2_9RHOB|nr:hypothetical protein [Rhodobaculum claviforme]
MLRSEAWSFVQAVFAAGVVFLASGAVFTLLFCRPLPGPVPVGSAGRAPSASQPMAAPSAAPPAAQPAASPEAAPTAAAGDAPAGAATDAVEDLQRIRGVGPKLAQSLLDRGVTGVAQIAQWSEADVAWWDENLEGFRGRVSRDGWVEQASALVAQDAAEGDAARNG